MRLSDILKKAVQKAIPAAPRTAPGQQQKTVPAPVPQAPAVPVSPQPDRASSALLAEDIYTQAIIEIKALITSFEKGPVYAGEFASIPRLASLVEQENEDILVLADRATPDVYLYGHCVNSAVFALALGHKLGFDHASLITLGLAACLNDIGMAKLLPLASKKEKLGGNDIAQIKKHAAYSQEMVRQMPSLSVTQKTMLAAVMPLVHERKPAGEAWDSVDEARRYAAIVSVADVYEALTHPRSHRDRFLPHDALKIMIGSAEHELDKYVIKALVERLSLYPPGSYVRLNTGEIAKVVGINDGLPTRPKVRIFVDAENQRPKETRVTDLSAVPVVFITEEVDETKLSLADKKLALELKAARWWVRGL